MSRDVELRLAQRSDIPAFARIANAANAQSAFHRRIAPFQDQHPLDYYHWRLNIIRQRFATPNMRTIVAEDQSSSEILGFASWAVEGKDTALYQQWTRGSGLADWLESKLIWIEKTWDRYTTDRSVDYAFLSNFMAAFQGTGKANRPPCLHCHLIVVDPKVHSQGVGQILLNWAKELAIEEELPIFLEANLEAVRFYQKNGFQRLGKDVCVTTGNEQPICLPAFVWEGQQREGQWLEQDQASNGAAPRYKWKNE